MLKHLGKTLVIGLAMFASASVMAGTFTCTVNAGGFTSNSGSTTDPSTSKASLALGPNAVVTHVGAAGTMTHYSPSWWCETRVRFANIGEANAYDLPLSADCNSGTTPFNVPLTPLVNPIGTGASGTLNVFALETYDDGANPDAVWATGSTISVQYTGDTAAACKVVVAGPTTCASEGYTGTKLTWCKNICENGLTGAALDTWIHRWINRYRDLPYCARDGGGEEEPPPQEL